MQDQLLDVWHGCINKLMTEGSGYNQDHERIHSRRNIQVHKPKVASQRIHHHLGHQLVRLSMPHGKHLSINHVISFDGKRCLTYLRQVDVEAKSMGILKGTNLGHVSKLIAIAVLKKALTVSEAMLLTKRGHHLIVVDVFDFAGDPVSPWLFHCVQDDRVIWIINVVP